MIPINQGLSESVEPIWTGVHVYRGGIALDSEAKLTIPAGANPWLINDSKTMASLYMVAQSDTVIETGIQILCTSARGQGGDLNHKIALFAVMNLIPGAGPSSVANFVLDVNAGVAASNHLTAEFDINVRNQDYGDALGAPLHPFAAPIYVAAGGTRRATAAMLINCEAYGGGGQQPFNWGLVARGGSLRQGFLGDFTNGPATLVIGGTKWAGIDMTGAVFTGAPIIFPGGLGMSYGAPDSAGPGFRLLRIPN